MNVLRVRILLNKTQNFVVLVNFNQSNNNTSNVNVRPKKNHKVIRLQHGVKQKELTKQA